MRTENRHVKLGSDGRFVINPALRDVLPAWLTVQPAEDVLPLTVVATASGYTNAGFVQPNFNEADPSYIIVSKLVFVDDTDTTALSAITCRLVDMGYNRDLMNSPLHIRAMFGTAQLPGVLYDEVSGWGEPLILQANGAIRAYFQKISGSAADIRPYMMGREIFFKNNQRIKRLIERKQLVTPFWLNPVESTVSLAANASTNLTIKVGQGHFQALQMTGVSTGNFSVEVMEVRTRRTLMNGVITQTNGLGNAQYPYFMPTPYLIRQGDVINVKITDLSGDTNRIFWSMFGKMYFCPIKHITEIEHDLAPIDSVGV